MISIESASVKVEIDVDRGAQLCGIRDARGRNALAWYEWGSPVGASSGQRYGDPEMDWLSDYRAGWQETVPNAGVACTVDGVPLPFHGEGSFAPWRVLEQSSTRCRLETHARLPLRIERTMEVAVDEPVLRIEGTVTNESDLPHQFVWGHHPAFPAVDGARIDVPAGADVHHETSRASDLEQVVTRWPDAHDHDGEPVDLREMPASKVHRLIYLVGLDHGWMSIRQPSSHVSVAMAWDAEVHPYAWMWVLRNTEEFPWFGRASVVAIEPQTAWPYDGLAGAISRKQAHRLGAGESLSTWLTLRLFDDDGRPVQRVQRSGEVSFGSTDERAGEASGGQ